MCLQIVCYEGCIRTCEWWRTGVSPGAIYSPHLIVEVCYSLGSLNEPVLVLISQLSEFVEVLAWSNHLGDLDLQYLRVLRLVIYSFWNTSLRLSLLPFHS